MVVEEPHVAGVWLEQHDVGLGMLARMAAEPVAQPAMEDDPEALARDGERSTFADRAAGGAFEHEGPDRVHDDDETRPAVDGEPGVRRLGDRRVEVVDTLD